MSTPSIPTSYGKTWRANNSSQSRSPESSSKPNGKPVSNKKKWIRRLLVAAVIATGLGLITAVSVFAWYSRDLPDPDKLLTRNLAQSTRIFDRTGETLLYEIHGEERRTIIDLEDIPEYMKEATITTEDRNFYQHHGVSLPGIIRAVVKDVFAGSKSQGGSTITQQFIKNAILTKEKSFTRKIKEVVLAYQIERKFSKDQILKLYFNEIPYGSVAYGVESAAQIYFGKSAKDVTLAEAAVLAALPQSPTYYSPYGSHVDDLFGRQKYILEQMAELGYITHEEAEAAKQEEIIFTPPRASIVAPHFVFYVKELLTQKYGEKMVEQGGLKVITSLDTYKQNVAEEEVEKGITKVEQYGGSNASLVALDPKTGEILAMVGSVDYFDKEHDGNVNVAIRNRQPGSSFKPVAYAAAFAKGYTPETMLHDVTTNFGGSPAYIPKNYDGGEHGPVSMRQALAGSLNIPAVKTLYLAGLNNTVELAKQLGYTTLTEPDRYGLSLVLGGGDVKLLEHVGAYSVFAREGLRHPVASILRVEDKDGKVLEEFKPEEIRVMDEQVARQINSVLSDNNARSFIFGSRNSLTLSDRPVAAKTGTTNDFHDAWTVGYTPSLVAGVWAGNNDNSEMKKGADGSVIAAPIWQGFMDRLLKGTPVESFKAPKAESRDKTMLNGQLDFVRTYKVDKLTKRVIPDSCLKTYPSEFVAERKFKETHTILHYVNKDEPLEAVPTNPSADPQYSSWEEAVQRWANGQPDYITASRKLPYESCSLRQGDPNQPSGVTLTQPIANAIVTTSPLTITAQVGSDFAIDRAEVYFDDTLITTWKTAPYTYSHDISALANGFYTVKVLFYDTAGAVVEKSASINVLLSSESVTLTINQPTNGSTHSITTFPLAISGIASHPTGITGLSIIAMGSNGEGAVIQSGIVIENKQFQTTWPSAPVPDTYSLFLRATLTDGSTIDGTLIDLTITGS